MMIEARPGASSISSSLMAPSIAARAADLLPYAPDSMARRVHGEGILLLGGGRALLMQIAHPAVARGVAEHSNFRGDRLGRLLRTLRPMLAIVFGTREEALAAAGHVNRLHERVNGPGYNATDPALLLWVFATLVDTTLAMHERFLRPLSPEEAAAYYRDMHVLARLLRIAPEAMPETVEELETYTASMCDSLRVTEEARAICEALFDVGPAAWPVMQTVRHVSAGLLPPGLRGQFGLSWGPKRERALRGLEAAARFVMPRVPERLRAPPWFLMPG